MNSQRPVRRTGTFPRAAVSHEKLYGVMGEKVLFRTNCPSLFSAADDAMKRYPQSSDDPAEPLVLELLVSDTVGSPPPYPPLVCRSHEHLLYLSIGPDNAFVADLQAGYTFGYLTKSMAADLAFVRYSFIEAAVQCMLGLAREFVAIHAACLVKDGISLAVTGPSGAGKSTLAYAGLKHGYRLLAEDVIQAKMGAEGMVFWGNPWKLHLLPESLPFFPELAGLETKRQVNGEWKIEVDVQTRFPGQSVPTAKTGPLIFLQSSKPGVRSDFRRLDLAEAQDRFEVIWSWDIGWKPHFDALLNAWLETGAFELQAGETPDQTVLMLDALFEDWKSSRV